jgi:hypothetical protein
MSEKIAMWIIQPITHDDVDIYFNTPYYKGYNNEC